MSQLNLRGYVHAYTMRKYGESDHKHSNRRSSRDYMSFIKRQERRLSRKVGKALIK